MSNNKKTTFYQVQISEQSLKLLQQTVNGLIAKATREVNNYLDLGVELTELAEQLSLAEPVKAPPKVKSSKAQDFVPGFCDAHPKYGAKRPPRTDCTGCWEAYKTYNPLAYDQARRKYERVSNSS